MGLVGCLPCHASATVYACAHNTPKEFSTHGRAVTHPTHTMFAAVLQVYGPPRHA
jgi:hypothetical protein